MNVNHVYVDVRYVYALETPTVIEWAFCDGSGDKDITGLEHVVRNQICFVNFYIYLTTQW